MARIELPETRVGARRRRRRALRASVTGLLVTGLLAGLVALAQAPFLRITAIAVAGAKTVPQAKVESLVREQLQGSYFYLFPKNNILLYPKGDIERALLAEYGEFKSVKARAENFRTLALAVVERESKALWCSSSAEAAGDEPETCYLMDDEGVAYAPAPQFSEPIYIEYRGEVREHFKNLSALVDAVAQTQPDNPVRTVIADESGDARVYFQKDFLLIFSLADGGGDIFERFSLALAAEPFKNRALADFEYLDLRFGDKLYYKLK